MTGMNREELRRAICASKKVYTNWVVAKRVARDVSRRHKMAYAAYRCRVCSRVHVGAQRSDFDVKRFKQKRRELYESDN